MNLFFRNFFDFTIVIFISYFILACNAAPIDVAKTSPNKDITNKLDDIPPGVNDDIKPDIVEKINLPNTSPTINKLPPGNINANANSEIIDPTINSSLNRKDTRRPTMKLIMDYPNEGIPTIKTSLNEGKNEPAADSSSDEDEIARYRKTRKKTIYNIPSKKTKPSLNQSGDIKVRSTRRSGQAIPGFKGALSHALCHQKTIGGKHKDCASAVIAKKFTKEELTMLTEQSIITKDKDEVWFTPTDTEWKARVQLKKNPTHDKLELPIFYPLKKMKDGGYEYPMTVEEVLIAGSARQKKLVHVVVPKGKRPEEGFIYIGSKNKLLGEHFSADTKKVLSNATTGVLYSLCGSIPVAVFSVGMAIPLMIASGLGMGAYFGYTAWKNIRDARNQEKKKLQVARENFMKGFGEIPTQ